MQVTYFRPRRPGPESKIEDAVAARIRQLFPETCWAAGSLPIGAGIPDLLFVRCAPKVFALANVDLPDFQILAYLRAVGSARPQTIADRFGQSEEIVIRNLTRLVQAEAVWNGRRSYSLAPEWRDILPEIVTVEAKVSNWRKAAEQAGRNSIFAHRSFVALPEDVAMRVRKEDIFKQLGVGLLSVSPDNEVTRVKECVRRKPRVWAYYYQVACFAAKHHRENYDGVCRVDGDGSGRLS